MEYPVLIREIAILGDGSSGTSTTATFNIQNGYVGDLSLLCGDITGLTYTFQVSADQGNTSVGREAVTRVGVPVLAGGTVTCTDGSEILFEGSGLCTVTVTRTGGSGPLYLIGLWDHTRLTAARLAQLATGGTGTSVGGSLPATRVVDTTLVVDTGIYAAGDLLSDSIAVAAARANDIDTYLVGMIFNDKSDNTAIAMTVYFLSANQSMGTINSAPNISDANADKILGIATIATTDWIDVGGSKQAVLSKSQLPILCKPASGTQNIYIATVVSSGTPTYASASDLTMRTSWQDCLA